ncbi:DnaD domain protein, partial [Collinsella aerofaciens]|nr:DnaD domain protein [Collinsella aerofaciens]
PNTPFSFLKNNILPPAGPALEQYYLPILEMETVTVYRFLLASYDQGEKKHLLAQILNHIDMGFPQLLLAFDRLIAMGLIDIFEEEAGIAIQLHAPLEAEQFFSNAVYKRLLEKKIGEKAVEDLLPARSLGVRRQVSFSQVFGLDAGEATVVPSKKQQFDMEMFKRMMGRDGLRFADEGEATLALFAIAEVDRIVSPKRMKQKLAQASQERPRMSYSRQEETILREAKAKSSLQFLAEIKKARNATITQSERKTLSKLADLGLLDEVINIILLLTFNKTQSANLNEKYALKVGNDFSYQGVNSAELAILKVRERQEQAKAQGNKGTSPTSAKGKHS